VTNSSRSAIRGPEAVQRSLIDAALQLMSLRSPRQISGRELAKTAGVNYGLIHHYFGSKDAVFAAAVAESTEEMALRWEVAGLLPLNTTDEARTYRTFSKLELDSDDSPVTDLLQRIVAGQAQAQGRETTDKDLLAEVALCAALQFGWGAFEPEIANGLAAYDIDLHELRDRVSKLSMRFSNGHSA